MTSTSTARRLSPVGSITPRQHRSMVRIFRAFRLEEALSDPTFDALKVLRGARAFLLGHVLESLSWEESLLDPGSRPHRCLRYRHAPLRREIAAFGRAVWRYQAAGGALHEGHEVVTGLRRRIVRVQALLEACAAQEEEGGVTGITVSGDGTR